MVQARYWCGTFNNPTPLITELVEQAFDRDDLRYYILGSETGDSGTEHLQAFFISKTRCTMGKMKDILGSLKWHLEKMRGTVEQAVEYCKKEGAYDENGVLPVSQQGKRNDLIAFHKWLKEKYRSDRELWANEQFFSLVLRYPRVATARDFLAPQGSRFNCPITSQDGLYDWQRECFSYSCEPATRRTIRFYIDKHGGAGKTSVALFCAKECPTSTQILTGGSFKDIAYVLDDSKSRFIFNIPKGGMEFLSYNILEGLKDGIIFSSKYESKIKTWGHNNMVMVLCNEDPDFDKLTLDRYDIKHIN
jgi:hypothetical protein